MKKLPSVFALASIAALVTAGWSGFFENGGTADNNAVQKSIFNLLDETDDFHVGVAAYEKGDYKTALTVFQKLVNEEGSTSSYVSAVQQKMAVMYERGEGVPQDYSEASRLYKLAAMQGNSSAQYRLALMYHDGNSLLQDYLRAHMWLNLAASSGLENARKDRDILAKQMTPEQIAEAQAMAKRCLASNYKDCD